MHFNTYIPWDHHDNQVSKYRYHLWKLSPVGHFLLKMTFNNSFFFSFIFISWRLITLQYCSGFCHTLTWISHGFTCVPHPEPPPASLPIPLALAFKILSSFYCVYTDYNFDSKIFFYLHIISSLECLWVSFVSFWLSSMKIHVVTFMAPWIIHSILPHLKIIDLNTSAKTLFTIRCFL